MTDEKFFICFGDRDTQKMKLFLCLLSWHSSDVAHSSFSPPTLCSRSFPISLALRRHACGVPVCETVRFRVSFRRRPENLWSYSGVFLEITKHHKYGRHWALGGHELLSKALLLVLFVRVGTTRIRVQTSAS